MAERLASGRQMVAEARPSRIGVVTVTFNSAEVLPDFFASLAAQSYDPFTLYVIDNSSNDATVKLCRERSNLPIVLIENRANLGVAEGNNQGIRAALEAGCECVLLLNNDTVLSPDLLATLHDGLLRYRCDMSTPKIFYHDKPDKIWAAGGHFQRWLGYRPQHYGDGSEDRGQFNDVRTISYAPTCCVLIRRSVFDRIGLMDPTYFVYSDDVDFMYRALRAGVVMKYLPSAIVKHKVSTLTGGGVSPFAIRYCTRNRVYFLRKNLPSLTASFWIVAYRIYLSARLILRCDSRQTWNFKKMAIREGKGLNVISHGG